MRKCKLLTCLMAFVLGVSLFNSATLFAKPGKGKKPKHTQKIKKHSPPPFAPAHGYKHKRDDGVELTYDTNIGVYLVVGKPDVYFQNGLFVTLSDGVWKVCASLNGEWRVHKDGEVPVKLKVHKSKAEKSVKTPKAAKGKGNKK